MLVPEQQHVQPAASDRPQLARILKPHEEIVAHGWVVMEEEKLGRGRIVGAAQNGFQTAQLPVADFSAGKVDL